MLNRLISLEVNAILEDAEESLQSFKKFKIVKLKKLNLIKND
jgi:hypothetical protein